MNSSVSYCTAGPTHGRQSVCTARVVCVSPYHCGQVARRRVPVCLILNTCQRAGKHVKLLSRKAGIGCVLLDTGAASIWRCRVPVRTRALFGNACCTCCGPETQFVWWAGPTRREVSRVRVALPRKHPGWPLPHSPGDEKYSFQCPNKQFGMHHCRAVAAQWRIGDHNIQDRKQFQCDSDSVRREKTGKGCRLLLSLCTSYFENDNW